MNALGCVSRCTAIPQLLPPQGRGALVRAHPSVRLFCTLSGAVIMVSWCAVPCFSHLGAGGAGAATATRKLLSSIRVLLCAPLAGSAACALATAVALWLACGLHARPCAQRSGRCRLYTGGLGGACRYRARGVSY